MCINLIAHRDGIVDYFNESDIAKLESCIKISMKVKPGEKIKKTTDITNICGKIYLCGTEEQIMNDL